MNVMVFFYAVVKEDYRTAAKIVNQKAILKNVAHFTHSHDVICAFSEKVASITVSVGKDYARILGYSHRTPLFFGFN
jgi:hypothetical protein